MRILVVAATEFEIPRLVTGVRGVNQIEVLVTGIGILATAAQVARALAIAPYDLAFNFGVCGSFDSSLAPGTVVHIVRDCLSELGVEDGDRLMTLEEAGLAGSHVVENLAPLPLPVLRSLPVARAITVNTVHGHEPSIARVVERLNPQVESMEGAAFAYACVISGVRYAQVRAVSNIVERRNRAAWRMDLAIQNLNDKALEILDSL